MTTYLIMKHILFFNSILILPYNLWKLEYYRNKGRTNEYVCVGSNDGIASWRTMQNRLKRLSELVIPTEFHLYDGLGHGFGIGNGRVAEG